jgi:hypothetical protein
VGVRTGAEPSEEQPFLERMLNALDMTPRDLAYAVSADPTERRRIRETFEYMLRRRLDELPDVGFTYEWTLVEEFLSRRVSNFLASKSELVMLRMRQEAKQRERRIELAQRERASAPRSLPRRPVFPRH